VVLDCTRIDSISFTILTNQKTTDRKAPESSGWFDQFHRIVEHLQREKRKASVEEVDDSVCVIFDLHWDEFAGKDDDDRGDT
jgi:hypothetical protein